MRNGTFLVSGECLAKNIHSNILFSANIMRTSILDTVIMRGAMLRYQFIPGDGWIGITGSQQNILQANVFSV